MNRFYAFACKSVLLLYFFFIISCQTSSTGVSNDRITSGLKGTVMDTTGKPLKNVKIYNLFFMSFLPNEVTSKQSLKKIMANRSFNFNLEQNFPNPLYNSTFIRFSLPDSADINFQIFDKLSNKKIYQFSESLPGGYYQRYLEKIVERYQMKNGAFRYILTANMQDSVFADTLELFVVSDKGPPNSITSAQGEYYFDYKETFAGDSLIYKIIPDFSSTIHLGNAVNLLFKKEGYKDNLITVTLYPDFIVNRDVVLMKEESK